MSEGRDRALTSALAARVESAGARLLDVHADPDHHRSVFTFVGQAPVVEAAVLALARLAVERLDLRAHRGGHPRIGAVDVVPFIPMREAAMADAVEAAHRTGARLGQELRVPVFYYGEAALRAERRELPAVRRGEFEGLTERMAAPGGEPDAGPRRPHPRAGATAIGARRVLVAFNAVLADGRLEVARAIAATIRESSGGLPGVRALGVALPSRGRVQVSMNLLDHRRTPLAAVVAAVEAAATGHGVTVLEYELVGCAPADAFAGVDRDRVRMAPGQLLDLSLFGPDSFPAPGAAPPPRSSP